MADHVIDAATGIAVPITLQMVLDELNEMHRQGVEEAIGRCVAMRIIAAAEIHQTKDHHGTEENEG